MSVLVSDRTESKFEAITYSIEIHDMLMGLMQRNFGIRDVDNFVRSRFARKPLSAEDFSYYRYKMRKFKDDINNLSHLMTNDIRAANTLYPKNMHEYEQRRDFQNGAIICCEQIIKELQRVVEVFDVDINIYSRYIKAINREIGLIKKWRQRDNRIKAYLQGSI